MTLSYKGHLGINKSDPEVQLDVVGHSTFTGSVRVIGDLEIDGGNLIGGNASLPAIIDASDINRPSGISTFGDIDVNNIIEIGYIFALGATTFALFEIIGPKVMLAAFILSIPYYLLTNYRDQHYE